jgi:hypothetical protein
MLGKLKSSPTAMDMALNQKGYDPIMLMASMISYYMKAIMFNQKKMGITANSKGDLDMGEQEALDTLHRMFNFSDLISKAPIVVALSNAFEQDRVNGKLAKNDYTRKLMADLSTPRFKEAT